MISPQVIALYLPQFHPIAENDSWWEPGFTEWTNVAKAKPLFKGHRQPNLPAELGFYDLRVPETRAQQAALAKEHGVSAFCYYHYWFGGGRRLLERPLDEVVASGEPDFNFMVCWANQTWGSVWHGLDHRILIEQEYPGAEDEALHFKAVLPMFRDPRYLRVAGKPVFMVYAPNEVPNTLAFTNHWRRLAAEAGLPGLYFLANHPNPHWDAKASGFDAFVCSPYFARRRSWVPWTSPGKKLHGKMLDWLGIPTRLDYRKTLPHFLPEGGSPLAIPCVLPNWDNTPRSGHRGVVFEGATPQEFGAALDRAIRICQRRDAADHFLFIKAWNEWGEGNHLEPNRLYGRGYLKQLQSRILPANKQ